MAYTPPYEITDKILNLVSGITEKTEKITQKSLLDNKLHLRRNNKIRSIHSSLRIEANSLSLSEVRDVINGQLVLGSKKEIREVKNAYEAYESISKINPYSAKELLKYHAIMTKYLVNESGVFRSGEEGVFNGDSCIFMAPPAKYVPEQIENLFLWMKKSEGIVHPLIMSAVFHYEFVFIHPFSDGNGRMARLWHTVILSKWKSIFEFIPIESQIEKFQQGYYDAIANCHLEGKSTKFIEFILEQICKCLDDVLALNAVTTVNESEYVKKLLNAMDEGIQYSANDILLLLGLKSKETLRKNYLIPAIEKGFVKMTVPDKPNSKNQRYVKIL